MPREIGLLLFVVAFLLILGGIWWLLPQLMWFTFLLAALIFAQMVGYGFPAFGRILGWGLLMTPLWFACLLWAQGAFTRKGGGFDSLGGVFALVVWVLVSVIGAGLGGRLLKGAAGEDPLLVELDQPENDHQHSPEVIGRRATRFSDESKTASVYDDTARTSNLATEAVRRPTAVDQKPLPSSWLPAADPVVPDPPVHREYRWITVALTLLAVTTGLSVLLQIDGLFYGKLEQGSGLAIVSLLLFGAFGELLLLTPLVWVYLWVKNRFRLNRLLKYWLVCIAIVVSSSLLSLNYLAGKHLARHARLLTEAVEKEDATLLVRTVLACHSYCNFEDDSAPLVWLTANTTSEAEQLEAIARMLQKNASRTAKSVWLKDRRSALEVAIDRYAEAPVLFRLLLGEESGYYKYTQISRLEGPDLESVFDYAVGTNAPEEVQKKLKALGAGKMFYGKPAGYSGH